MKFEQMPSPGELERTPKERGAPDKKLSESEAKYMREARKEGGHLETTDQQIDNARTETQKDSSDSGFGALSMERIRNLIYQEQGRTQVEKISKLGLERLDSLHFLLDELDKFERWRKDPENNGRDWDDYLGERYKVLYGRAHKGMPQVVQDRNEKDLKNILWISRDFSISMLEELSRRSSAQSNKIEGKGETRHLTLKDMEKQLHRFYKKDEEGRTTLREFNPADKFSREEIGAFIDYTVGVLKQHNTDLQEAKKRLGRNVTIGTNVAAVFGTRLASGGAIIQRILATKGRYLSNNEVLKMDIRDAIKQATGFELDKKLTDNL